MRREEFKHCRRLVVKVGTSSITLPSGELNLEQIAKLVDELAAVHREGKEVLLVSSGAIGAGMGRLGLRSRPRTIPEKQACAAVGQGLLMQIYERFFSSHGITVGQVLLTRDDFAHRRRFLNARNTLLTLLEYRVVPIINENDTVAVEEIRLGDNDTLSALVASLINAELLLILSDVDGLYTGDPRRDPQARLISEVKELTPEIWALAGGPGSQVGSGGMLTKLEAARIAGRSGCTLVIARASLPGVIRRVLAGEEIGTVFFPREKLREKRRWLLFGAQVKGKIYVDAGAAKALREGGKSLLPSGIVGVEGNFEAGHAVSIVDPEGKEIARGLVNYSAAEVEQIKGCKTCEIEAVLGSRLYDEVVHRDNLVLQE
ncbi:glutamate 5-kinase [Ammonifex degensii KC4]|uniref:Glutamate 5-kinase n=1 Tax=Ammonifex degensii (strain DSM 10501 / KC4) TaxID=429009 RepID=C9RAT1_AMMDK|nr:glutamate 5-kinase [Ammonifex degensii]ACX51358.1 glutamate 5-kinase [Ammonifex degensii KC4]